MQVLIEVLHVQGILSGVKAFGNLVSMTYDDEI